MSGILGANLAAPGNNPYGVVRIDVEHLRDFNQLDDIQAALTALVFGDKGLRPAKLIGDLLLGQASALSRCNKPVE